MSNSLQEIDDPSAPPDVTAEDRQLLHDLVIEHAWLLDHSRWHDIADLYVEEGARLTMGPKTVEGRPAFLQWADQRASNTARVTHHQCTNIRLVSSGEDAAEGSVMLVLYVSTDLQPAEVEFVGEYRDQYRREQGRWLFSQRTLVPIAAPRGGSNA